MSSSGCSEDSSMINYDIPAFGFESRTAFNARKNILNTRNDKFSVPPHPEEENIWSRKPPDFRLQAYAPKPPKRNTRDAMQPWRYASKGDSLPPREDDLKLPPLIRSDMDPDLPAFVASQRPLRPRTARQLAITQSTLTPGEYNNPQPYDFRGLIPLKKLGLPEFLTFSEKDPFNIKLELANRRTIVGELHNIQNIRDCSGTMAGLVRQPPKWDPQLYHPRIKWPRPTAEYTRYRIQNRDVHDAFMDRVEETLLNKWQQEKQSRSMPKLQRTCS